MQTDKEKYVRAELEELIDWFANESTSHKKLYRRLRYVVFGLTACSSAFAGLALAFPRISTEVTVVVVLTTAGIGIATSIEGLRKPSELWLHERTLYYSLKDLQREFDYRSAEPNNRDLTETIFVRLQDILGSGRDKWSRQIASREIAQSLQDSAE